MFSSLIGNVDVPAAAVLIALCVTICIIVTTMIVKRRSRLDVSNEHDLAILKNNAEISRSQYIAETTRMVEFKKIDQGLITSHREE